MDLAGNDKANFVKKTFNTIARRYDLMNTLMSFGLDRKWRRLAVSKAEARPRAHMLDICCGTGQLALALARAVGPAGQVTGVDFSEGMLAVAHSRIAEAHVHNIVLQQADAMALPFADDSFDGATVGWGLRNLPELRRGVSEMVRVVKPGGMVVSLDMAKPTLPVFKQAYWLYFEQIVPLMGELWAGKKSAYRYLYESARAFPPQQELARLFAALGLRDTGYQNLAGGVVALVYGRKPL